MFCNKRFMAHLYSTRVFFLFKTYKHCYKVYSKKTLKKVVRSVKNVFFHHNRTPFFLSSTSHFENKNLVSICILNHIFFLKIYLYRLTLNVPLIFCTVFVMFKICLLVSLHPLSKFRENFKRI